MAQEIRHRRLHAFFESKVLNTLSIVITASLSMVGFTRTLTLPLLCAAIAFAIFVSYSLWVWIKKPSQIVINNLISNLSFVFSLYFIVVAVIMPANPWWFAVPLLSAIVLLSFSLIKPADRVFDI